MLKLLENFSIYEIYQQKYFAFDEFALSTCIFVMNNIYIYIYKYSSYLHILHIG